MSFEVKHFIRSYTNGTLQQGEFRRFFQWDGMSLSDLQDFVRLYSDSATTIADVTVTDPSGPNVYGPTGNGSVWVYDPAHDDYGPYQVYPGNWIEVKPFHYCEIPVEVDLSGYVEIPRPGA